MAFCKNLSSCQFLLHQTDGSSALDFDSVNSIGEIGQHKEDANAVAGTCLIEKARNSK